jgi:hypothetical protein
MEGGEEGFEMAQWLTLNWVRRFFRWFSGLPLTALPRD